MTPMYIYVYEKNFLNICILVIQVNYRLLQNIEYSSLCYTVGPYWLSYIFFKIRNLILMIYVNTALVNIMSIWNICHEEKRRNTSQIIHEDGVFALFPSKCCLASSKQLSASLRLVWEHPIPFLPTGFLIFPL